MNHCLFVVGFSLLSIFANASENSPVKASFDCNKAKSSVEKKICANDDLKSLDWKVGEVYKKLQNSLPANQLPQIKSEAKGWLSLRDKTCASSEDPKCLTDIYQSRLKSLEQFTVALKETSPRNSTNQSEVAQSLSESQTAAILKESQTLIFPSGESKGKLCDSPSPSVRQINGLFLLAYFECDAEVSDGRDADEIEIAVMDGALGRLKIKSQANEGIEKTIEQGIFDLVEIDSRLYPIGPNHSAFVVRVGSEFNSTSTHETGTQLLLIESLGSTLRTILKLPVAEDSSQKISVDSSQVSNGYFNVSVTTGRKTKSYHWKKGEYVLTGL